MISQSLFVIAAFAASFVKSAPTKPHKRQAPNGVPDYVLEYAPIVYLYSEEQYLPTDLQVFLDHTTPRVNFNPVAGPSTPLNLSNVNQEGANVFLTSNDDVTTNPQWMLGVTPDAQGKTNGAVSAAIIVNDKGNGDVDAFYMYFYGYNYGGEVLGWKDLNFDDHVGDWEHNMVRFSNGQPQAVWYSQHANGEAFTYAAVEKVGVRPVSYSATGSHANYAISGTHDHTIPNLNLPGGPLQDYTDKGPMWDPTLSAYYYKFDAAANSFEAYDSSTPTGWLYFDGRWGDEQYPASDKRQIILFGEAKFTSGPTGPNDKQLNRTNVCPQDGVTCILRSILVPRSSETNVEGYEVVV